ncbi:hypothetical protein PVAP13_6KG160712 [Panicum virgatum]|uniref:Uncharacterized protein n=1 Tax=Panicum virgatum TaxID=38727 RepID=A0A8T0RBU4_PANVG|nr:hypothetical protein PVAP13_6KG160712 [Panicum virgatum]
MEAQSTATAASSCGAGLITHAGNEKHSVHAPSSDYTSTMTIDHFSYPSVNSKRQAARGRTDRESEDAADHDDHERRGRWQSRRDVITQDEDGAAGGVGGRRCCGVPLPRARGHRCAAGAPTRPAAARFPRGGRNPLRRRNDETERHGLGRNGTGG